MAKKPAKKKKTATKKVAAKKSVKRRSVKKAKAVKKSAPKKREKKMTLPSQPAKSGCLNEAAAPLQQTEIQREFLEYQETSAGVEHKNSTRHGFGFRVNVPPKDKTGCF